MLLENASDIISKSYSKQGDLVLLRMRNFNNGYGRSQKQKQLYDQSKMINLILGSVLDHVSLDSSGNIQYTLRSTDEQINRSLVALESVAEINRYATVPLLFHKVKPSIITSQGSLPNGVWVEQGEWNGSTNLFPTVGALGDSVKKGYTWDNTANTTTLLGIDGGPIPAGATIMAKVDSPGQILTNWRIFY